MNFLSRAFKNATRKLSKSILLAVTFFVIGNFVIIGLGVSNASDNAKILTRQKMRAVVDFSSDWQNFYEAGNKIEDEDERNVWYRKGIEGMTLANAETMLSDPRVKTANALYHGAYYADNFEYVKLNNKNEENSENARGSITSTDFVVGGSIGGGYSPPNVKVLGNALPNMIEFADNMYVLKDGRMYTQEEINNKAKVALITDSLAELNNLKIGDTIRISMVDKSELTSEGGTSTITEEDALIEYEIIGIFDNMEQLDPTADDYQWKQAYDSPENIVLVPRSTLTEAEYGLSLKRWDTYKQLYPDDTYYSDPANRQTEEQINQIDKITILLNDPLDVEEFVADYQESIPEYTIFNSNNETFEKLSKPLDTMSLFANFIVWLVIINAAIIITLVTALTLKTREYEIGVLLSMGVSKVKIVGQFFVELAIIAIIGFSAAVISGSLVAKQVGATVLEYQVSVSDVTEEDEFSNGIIWGGSSDYFTEISLEDMISEYEVSISPLIIAEIYIAGLGIVLVSILIPSLMIMRFNPKRILMNTN